MDNKTFAVVYLHGFTASGYPIEFEEIKKEIEVKNGIWIVPQAENIEQGWFKIKSWTPTYDIQTKQWILDEDVESIHQARNKLDQFISKIMTERNLPAERIIVCGFSQGGSLATYWGYTTKIPKIKAVLGFCCHIPLIMTEFKNFTTNAPVCLLNGTLDSIMRWDVFQSMRQYFPFIQVDSGDFGHDISPLHLSMLRNRVNSVISEIK